MGRAQDHMAALGVAGQERLNLVFPGDPLALRSALAKAMAYLRDLDFDQDQIGPVELVLAEAINNVIEHAFAGHMHGVVELTIHRDQDVLNFTVLDDGLPMPDEEAPAGLAQDLNCETDDLPEGGFGWFLIRELTRNLAYSRVGNRNRLEFSMLAGTGLTAQ